VAERVAHFGAVEARADGISWVCSPMVDIARDPRWGRITESNGEDPYLGSAMARAWVKGYQQGDLSRSDSVAAGVKHFAAYGAVIAGREYKAVDMSEITLRQVYLEPYRVAVEAGAATVMSSYVSLNGIPASANPFLLKKILREEWGFNGIVVSDDGAIGELRNHGIGADRATVARKALESGVDMDMDGKLFGTVIARQGDEIGMKTTASTRKEDVRDSQGVTGWPKEKGRDGERTPMQWDASVNAGLLKGNALATSTAQCKHHQCTGREDRSELALHLVPKPDPAKTDESGTC
jgi:beta-glucosidase-like glycosyl hydrolase